MILEILIFAGGVAVGAAYKPLLTRWKNKAAKAVHAAHDALQD